MPKYMRLATRIFTTFIFLVLISTFLLTTNLVAFDSGEVLVTSSDEASPTTPTVTAPEGLTAFDTPNDSVGNISLSWKAMPYERKDILYVIYISRNPDGPFETEACPNFPSTEKWKKDKEWPFWVSGKKEGYHYIEVNPGNCFPPASLAELNKQKASLRELQARIEELQKNKQASPELEQKKLALQEEIKSLAEKVNREREEIRNAVYYFKIGVKEEGKIVALSSVVSARAQNNWFNLSLLNNFIVMILFCGLVLWYISYARKKRDIFLRRISGLDAIEEAVGRATEMGRSVFYLTGIGSMDDIATIAATVILGKVSERIALYDTQIKVPHRDPIVLTVCQEIVKEAYIKAGRPDAYNPNSNFFVTSDQFSYTATVNGMMSREKPAANFFMGSYMAEALLLAEAGSMTGAIQIAATDSTVQLPFFITSCDYTLIGEELYAASAYLSREPVLVGTLKAQDLAKGFLLAALILGTVFATLYLPTILDIIKDFS